MSAGLFTPQAVANTNKQVKEHFALQTKFSESLSLSLSYGFFCGRNMVLVCLINLMDNTENLLVLGL